MRKLLAAVKEELAMTDSKAIPLGYDTPIPSFAILRLVGPPEPWLDNAWKPEDIEPFA